jgi:hypothetical protein
MWARILIAGIIGGILVFVMGFISHGILQLQGRAFQNIPEGESFVDQLKARSLKPGLYWFPDMPMGADQNDKAKMDEANARYKVGPAGFLLVMPSGHDMMTLEMLGMEFATDVVAALLAAWIVSLIGTDVGFGRRWLAVVTMGAFAWFSLSTSYGIWYHFPHKFIHDEFLCALLEWSVAGIAIAAIVRRRLAVVTTANT